MNDSNSTSSSFQYLKTNITATDSSSAFITTLNKNLNSTIIGDDSSNEFIINSKSFIQKLNSQNKLQDALDISEKADINKSSSTSAMESLSSTPPIS